MNSPLHTLKEIASFVTTLIAALILITIFIFMGYSIFYIVPYISQPKFAIPIYIVIPFPILIFYLYGMATYAWYIFLAIAISISGVVMLVYGAIPYYRSFVKNPSAYRKNAFQELSELYALNIFFSMLIVYILLLVGYTPQTPGIGQMPVWQQMLGLLHASVYEELIVRTVFLGIPVFLVYLLRGEKISPLRIFGGYGKITAVEVVFIIVSASIFAVAHIPAWNVWKVMPTFVGGLILGYLYIRYGIYASIMMHFMTDFISIPMAINRDFQYLFGLLMIILAIMGVFFFASYTIRLVNYFSKKKPVTMERRNTSVTSWSTLVCPNCGGTVFQYVDKNTVRCVKCGTEIRMNDDNQDYFT